MEEIRISDILYAIRDKVKFIIIIAILFGVLGEVYSRFMVEPLYKATCSLVLTKNQDTNSTVSDALSQMGISQGTVETNQTLVTTYGNIITSDALLSTVINNLALDMTTTELAKEVSIQQVTGTQVIEINVSDTEGDRCDKIANNLTDEFQKEVANIYGSNNLYVIEYAKIATIPYNVDIIKTSLLFLAIGLVFSIGLVFVRFYFDTTIKSGDDVERILEIKVLASMQEQLED